MKKVLIVMSSLYNGGAEKSLVNFLNELPKDKYQVDLLLFKKEGMFLKQVPEYINVLDTPVAIKKLYGGVKKSGKYIFTNLFGNFVSMIVGRSPRHRRAFRWKYFYSSKIPKLEGHYDVAMAYISGEIFYYIDEKVDADKKIVWVHNDYRSGKFPKKFDYPHFKNMDYIVSISEECVNILKEEFPEYRERMKYIPNITSAIAVRKRAMEFIPKEFDYEHFNLLSIGRLTEQKGFDLAIEAMSIVKQSNYRNIKWYIIGNGELESSLKKKIQELGLEDTVYLIGTRDNPYPYIKECSLFVQPSRYEGKSVVLDEAKILAKPILATNYPTVKDQLIDEKEGVIVDFDAEKLAEKIIKIYSGNAKISECEEYLKNHSYGNQDDVLLYMNMIG